MTKATGGGPNGPQISFVLLNWSEGFLGSIWTPFFVGAKRAGLQEALKYKYVRLSVCMSVCPSVCPSVRLSIHTFLFWFRCILHSQYTSDLRGEGEGEGEVHEPLEVCGF